MSRSYKWAIWIIVCFIFMDYGAEFIYAAVWSYLNPAQAVVSYTGKDKDNSRLYRVKISKGSWCDTGIFIPPATKISIQSVQDQAQPYWIKLGSGEFRSRPIENGSAFELSLAVGDFDKDFNSDLERVHEIASIQQEEKAYLRLDPQDTVDNQELLFKISGLRWSRFDGHEILLAKSSNLYEKNISKICRQQDHQNASQV